jgi:hypothetical protein
MYSVMILRLTFGLVWLLQGDERAAQHHGGNRYGVGGGCTSPGQRGSDLLRERVFSDQAEGRIAGLCVLHRVWQPVEQRQGVTADTARAMRACGVMLNGATSPTFSAVGRFA